MSTDRPLGSRKRMPALGKPAPPSRDNGVVLGPLATPSVHESWMVSFRRQIGELMDRNPLPLPRYRSKLKVSPDGIELGPMCIDGLQKPWFESLRDQIRDTLRDRKLRPLKVTSKPVPVKDIWGAYNNKPQGLSISAGVHVTMIVLLFTVFSGPTLDMASGDSIELVFDFDLAPYLAEIMRAPPGESSGGGGGGGQNSPLPPSKGKLPRFDITQLAPPPVVIRNPDPELAVEPTVIVQNYIELPQINMSVFGDPLGKIGPPSAGPGSGGGIGTGRGTGVGSGTGAGVGAGSGGGIGGGAFRVGGGVSAPRLTRKIEPEYSEQARKAKYQGTVILAIEVWEDGRAHNIRIIRSLGLGLDEKAMEAVQQWRFIPGRKDNRPVKVRANIEVNFRLL